MQTFKTSVARENILSRIRKGLGGKPLPMPYPEAEANNAPLFYDAVQAEGLAPEEVFAEEFIKLGGRFVFCGNEQDMLENIAALYEARCWKQLLCADKDILRLFRNNRMDIAQPADNYVVDADACITGCEALVARTGSVLISSRQHMGRTAPVFYPVHLVVAYASQLTPDIEHGLNLIKKKYNGELPSMINLNTGPSRTADIEKTLVVGVHGPGEVFCFLINA